MAKRKETRDLEVRDDLKRRLKDTGKKASDLARELGLNYNILNGYLNGRQKMKVQTNDKINAILSLWENGLPVS